MPNGTIPIMYEWNHCLLRRSIERFFLVYFQTAVRDEAAVLELVHRVPLDQLEAEVLAKLLAAVPALGVVAGDLVDPTYRSI